MVFTQKVMNVLWFLKNTLLKLKHTRVYLGTKLRHSSESNWFEFAKW